MQITLTIPPEYAEVIERLAAADGITPTQWVTRTVKRAIRPTQAPRMGRPTINQERDAAIRTKRDAGMTIKALADEYGLSIPRINQILSPI